ncbi:MAG TPA: helix-turn-helix transcriptional regulator [Vicinamibacteria bacterium]|nr:helix-turn-helix transcriptional regulator [Vicinamibacteria bacterium]
MTPTLPMLQILLALVDGDRHGYGILLEIERRTGRRLGTGTLYTTLQRLLAKKLIEETDKRPHPADDDARRKYYRLTRTGREMAERESTRLERVVEMARAKALLS